MPRDSAGNYDLPPGNPVQSGEVISSAWANTTLDDVAVALTDSLDRQGRGGMLAPFQFDDGTNLEPGATWVNETTTGLYRFDGGDLRMAVLTQDVMRWQTSGAQMWNNTDMQWEDILTTGNNPGKVGVNPGTQGADTLRWNGTTNEWDANSNVQALSTGDLRVQRSDVQGNIYVSFDSNAVPNQGSIGRYLFEAKLPDDTPTVATIIDSRADQAWSNSGAGSNLRFLTTPNDTLTPVEAMRINNAGDVGIGETAPNRKLHIKDNLQIVTNFESTSTVSQICFSTPTQDQNMRISLDDATASMGLWTTATQRMVIDGSSGFVGVGSNFTDPESLLHSQLSEVPGKAWSANAGEALRLERNNTLIMNLVTNNAQNIDIRFSDEDADGAGRIRYTHSNNKMEFFTSNTSRVTIDDTGELGIGTTTPTASVGITVQKTETLIGFRSGVNSGPYLRNPAAQYDNAPIYAFYFNGTTGISNPANGQIGFKSAGSEVARFTTSALWVGKTATGQNVTGFEAVNNGLVYSASTVGNNLRINRQAGNGQITRFYVDNADSGGITVTSGGLPAFYSGASDARLKENVQPLEGALDQVLALNPCTFDWLPHSGFSGSGEGFVAQELREVWPDCVQDADEEAETDYLTVMGLGPIEARLIAAIQELNAKVDALSGN